MKKKKVKVEIIKTLLFPSASDAENTFNETVLEPVSTQLQAVSFVPCSLGTRD